MARRAFLLSASHAAESCANTQQALLQSCPPPAPARGRATFVCCALCDAGLRELSPWGILCWRAGCSVMNPTHTRHPLGTDPQLPSQLPSCPFTQTAHLGMRAPTTHVGPFGRRVARQGFWSPKGLMTKFFECGKDSFNTDRCLSGSGANVNQCDEVRCRLSPPQSS